MLQPITPDQVAHGDYPTGGYSFTGLLPPAPVSRASRVRLLGGAELIVPPPPGAPADGPAVLEQVASELGDLLGGAFGAGAVLPFTQHGAPAAPEYPARNETPGPASTWDRPRHDFYWLAARLDDWRVQGCGEPGDLHCVSFHRPVEAPARNGPADAPGALLTDLAPALAARLDERPAPDPREPSRSHEPHEPSRTPHEPSRTPHEPHELREPLRDVTAAYSPGLFGTALSAPELRIRTGIRQALGADGAPLGLVRVLRIDAGPGCRDWPGP
ncbi:hypothetical protein [Streptomyces sp. MMBL 11-1]|uniref:hypothetical protein n=1 Tax=Streptomyces sp. MMBL 11-1 TaxID=3026420 RepID=UPI00235DE001|nr:hypothetical protein [Streptomyces sp. MMBL 11-1]